MNQMNPEIREQWATALESEEYSQGRGNLCHLNSDGIKEYCCLGVLTDLYLRAHELKWVSYLNMFGISYTDESRVGVSRHGVNNTGLEQKVSE